MSKNHSKPDFRAALLAGAATAAVLCAVSAASAQQTIETVVVTGSRIPVSSNLTSTSPVQTVTNQQFQVKGATDVSQLLNDMPQTFISNTGDFSNTNNPLSSPGGITTIDLRGLGAQRTLVLVNGRRLGVGDPNTGNPGAAPDIDQIPVPLVDRVEVLTGGASSTYGSDAVAGVVNFVMRQDFEGVQVDAQWGGEWHDNTNSFARAVEANSIAAGTQGPFGLKAGQNNLAPKTVFDGQNVAASIIVGTNTADGKGNVTGYVTYRQANPVWMRNRDYAACQINVVDPGAPYPSPMPSRVDVSNCSGSSNSNYFRPAADATSYSVVGNQLLARPHAGSSPPSSFNSNAYESLSRKDSRYSGGFFAHYDLASYAKPYAEFEFMDDRSYQQIAPVAMFRGANSFSPDGSGNWFVNCDNPLLSAQEVSVLCTSQGLSGSAMAPVEIGRRNIEGGGRFSTYEHLNFRGVVGVKGEINDAWHYDVFGSYYYVTADQNNGNYLSNTKINNALNVVSVGGVPTCASVVNGTDTACVPYNIWSEGGVTQAQLNYLNAFGTSRGTLFEEILEIDLNGDLGAYGVRSPFARDGVQVAIGFSSRKDKMTFQGDMAEANNDLEGFGGAAVPIDNGINVGEQYGEIRIPLAQDMPLIQDLSVDGGIRFSSYTNGHKPTTWKVGLQWAPNSDIRFRTSYDVAIRAASILESFTPQTVTNTSIVSVDPCAGATPTATLAQCMNTGVTAAQYGTISQCPSGQCAIELGGNPALAPEKAKTFSIGFTATPSFLEGFSGSVDYYKIDVYNGIIQGIPINISLQQCLATGAANYCSLVRRTSAGTLFGTTVSGGGYIIGTNVNSGFFNDSGVDFQGDYQMSLDDVGLEGYGSLGFHMTGTYQITAKNQPLASQPGYDCAGLFGNTCGSPLPRWRHVFRVNWETPWDVMLAASWRYIGGSGLDSNTSQAALTAGAIDHYNANLPAVSYLDLAVTWQMTKELQLRAGMNNVFDTDPPIISDLIAGTGAPNAYNSYDMLGRDLFVAITAKL